MIAKRKGRTGRGGEREIASDQVAGVSRGVFPAQAAKARTVWVTTSAIPIPMSLIGPKILRETARSPRHL
jgi:hypothetical protein